MMPSTRCAVIGCHNNKKKLRKWREQRCGIHNCLFETSNCFCEPPFKLFPFPKDPDNLDTWIRLINRQDCTTTKRWAPLPDDRVCSFHFPNGKPTDENPNPVVNLGYTLNKTPTSRRKLIRQNVQLVKKSKSKKVLSELFVNNTTPIGAHVIDTSDQIKESQLESDLSNCGVPKEAADHDDDDDDVGIASGVHSNVQHKLNSPDNVANTGSFPELHDHSYINLTESGVSQSKSAAVNVLKTKVKHLQEKLYKFKHSKQSLVKTLLVNDKKVKFYTGLPSKSAFTGLVQYINDFCGDAKYWKGKKAVICTKAYRKYSGFSARLGARVLFLQEEILLVLMKLRLGLLNQDLADRFEISAGLCSKILNSRIKFLSSVLGGLIQFVPKESIQGTLPNSFKQVEPNTRVIIDCTEMYIERPRDLVLQTATWSDYKKSNTIKYLVGISPIGMITFLSKGWPGRTSDVQLTRQSGFYDLLDPNDVVMADRGFPIKADLALRHCRLYIPPAAKGQMQMTGSDVKKTKVIANLRIHVERAINRIKSFKILKETLPLTLLPLLNDIVIVCAALCNLMDPLVK